ncbi:unnamed protein product [Clavelina lepadiformis]|uniref:NSFL1 cofactor p47 n=1 Tax=Clavelina lepadiformis TaxID=159417 RepID=A0ABP0H5Z4_CLALP
MAKLPVALSSFYDTGAGSNNEANVEAMDEDYQPSVDEGAPNLVPPTDSKGSTSNSALTTKSNKSKATKTGSSRFASIHDFGRDQDQSSDEEGQRFYAGGSEQSGELIVGPPRKKQSNDEIAKNLFTEAKKHGAQAVEASSRDTDKSKSQAFAGGGYKLGETEEDSQFIPGQEPPQERGPVNVSLRLWSNGFTVDDGPLREFKDPANEDFLNSIKKGEIPRELLRNAHGGEVHVDMEDHRNEEFKAPKKKLKPFTGKGNMLGSPTPEFSSSTKVDAPKLSSSVDPPLTVDKSKPSTTLQIRLSDGKRLKQEFNQSHRISDIRNYLCNMNPELSTRPFILMTTFPNKELADESLTLSEAKLLNAVVVQKLV